MRSKYVRIRPNENTDSNKLNRIYNAAAEDIADLYSLSFQARSDLETQGIALPLGLNGIETQVALLKNQLDLLTAGNLDIITLYDSTKIIYPSSVVPSAQCSYVQRYGEAVLPIANTTVEYHAIDPVTGKRTLVVDPEQYIKSFLTNNKYQPRVSEVTENNVVNAINQENMVPHVVRTRTRQTSTTTMTLVYEMDLVTDRNINTITIHPLPEFLTDFQGVSVTVSGSNSKIRGIDDLPLDFPITQARKRRFHFSPVLASSVQVMLGTPVFNLVDEQGTKEFSLGCSLISIESNSYINEGYIGLMLEVPQNVTQLGRVVPIFEGGASNIEVSVFTSLSEFNSVSGSYLLTGDALTIQSQLTTPLVGATNLYVLFRLTKQENNTTPILKGCTIQWLS